MSKLAIMNPRTPKCYMPSFFRLFFSILAEELKLSYINCLVSSRELDLAES